MAKELHTHTHVDAEGHVVTHTHEVETGHAHGHHHSPEEKKKQINRLSRAMGHLQHVKSMIENDEDCAEVLVQIAAVRSAIDNTGKLILQDHLKHCIVEAAAEGDQKTIDDLCDAIDKFM